MASETMVLISAIVTLLFSALFLFLLVRNEWDWRVFRRGPLFRFLLLLPFLFLLAMLNAFLTSTVLLLLLLALVAVAGYHLWRAGRQEAESSAPAKASGKNVIDLPAGRANGRSSGIAAKTEKMPEPPLYSLQVKKITLSRGVEIAYTETGKGPYTLIFVHGLGSNRKCWRKNVMELRRHFRCIALDLPGYGQSSRGAHAYSMSFFAKRLIEFIEVLQPRHPVLVGHSMGGQISITALLRAPDLVRKLILLAPAGFETFSATEKALVRSFYRPALIRATPAEQIRHNFAANFYEFPADAEFMIEDRMALRQSEDHLHYSRMIPKCMMSMMEEPVFHRLSEIRPPTLIIFGADDQLIPNKMMHPGLTTVAVAESGAANIPTSRLEIMRPCGHFVQWECAPAVNRSIRGFLS